MKPSTLWEQCSIVKCSTTLLVKTPQQCSMVQANIRNLERQYQETVLLWFQRWQHWHHHNLKGHLWTIVVIRRMVREGQPCVFSVKRPILIQNSLRKTFKSKLIWCWRKVRIKIVNWLILCIGVLINFVSIWRTGYFPCHEIYCSFGWIVKHYTVLFLC